MDFILLGQTGGHKRKQNCGTKGSAQVRDLESKEEIGTALGETAMSRDDVCAVSKKQKKKIRVKKCRSNPGDVTSWMQIEGGFDGIPLAAETGDRNSRRHASSQPDRPDRKLIFLFPKGKKANIHKQELCREGEKEDSALEP